MRKILFGVVAALLLIGQGFAAQNECSRNYQQNGEIGNAVRCLEKISGENSCTAKYQQNGEIGTAVSCLEQRVKNRSCAEKYNRNGEIGEAVICLEKSLTAAVSNSKTKPVSQSGFESVPEKQRFPNMGKDQYGIYADVSLKTNAQPVTQRFRWIEPGTFMMGSPKSEQGRDNDEVHHQVTLTKGYWMADTETTLQLWEAIMGKHENQGFKGEQRPVENVSWNDVQKFLEKLKQRNPELNAKLPTEAEWEYATRAGTTTPFSFEGELTLEKVNYWSDGSKKETVNVKSLPPNPWGLYEVHGNVYEWTADAYGKLPAEPVSDPLVEAGSSRVIRGGSWLNNGQLVRSAYRFHDGAGYRNDLLGFRISLGH